MKKSRFFRALENIKLKFLENFQNGLIRVVLSAPVFVAVVHIPSDKNMFAASSPFRGPTAETYTVSTIGYKINTETLNNH